MILVAFFCPLSKYCSFSGFVSRLFCFTDAVLLLSNTILFLFYFSKTIPAQTFFVQLKRTEISHGLKLIEVFFVSD